MKMKLIVIASLLLVLIGCSPKEIREYKNPVLSGMNPDPSICMVGDDFYMVTSTFEYFPGLPIYHSKDLVNWKLIGHGLSRPDNNPLMGCTSSVGGQYAATLRYNKGKFYLIGTNYGGIGTKGVSYVTATNPAGPWSEPVWLDCWYVDPSLEFINDTMYYLSPDNEGSFLLGILDPETGKFIEKPRKVAEGLGGSSPEGPHLYHINGYYYIMSAEGGTGYEHREVIQRSKSPWGPYEPSPINPVMSHMNDPQNPFHAIGHADLIQLKDNSWWAVCLGIRPKDGKYQHLGRETFLSPITWSKDGWPRVGSDGIVKETFPAPNLPEHKWAMEPVRDDFDKEILNLEWNFIRNPDNHNWSLTDKPGFLRLKGTSVNFSGFDSPAFIGRRQKAFNLVAATKINFNPTAENEEAGLVVRANDANYLGFLITQKEGVKQVVIRQLLNDSIASETYLAVEAKDVELRIVATEVEYEFWVVQEGQEARLTGTVPTKVMANENVGCGFTGVFIGLYASGNGIACVNPADFDWFDFELKD